MHTRSLFLLGSLIALLLTNGAHAQVTQPDMAAIDAYISKTMRDDRVPGVALAIVHDQQIVYLRGYGDDGYGRAVTPQTGFLLGSISKSFTALAIMQLVERRLVDLESPVQEYLTWFRVADPAASRIITIRHLLNHTSGIPTRAPQATEPAATLQDHVRALASVVLSNPPGSTHEYASPNYLVLGAVIEQVTGQSYSEYIEQKIFVPLGMTHSFTDQDRAIASGMAQGHRYWFGFPVPATLPYERDRMPTAALISSAADLGQYLLAQLNQGRVADETILSPAGMAQLHAPGAPADDFSYAFGWRVGTIAGVPAIHHGGIVPHFRGKLVMLPEQGWGVAIVTNASTAFPLPITPTSHHMADAIAGYLVGQPLADRSYSQSTIYTAITIGMALIIFSQLSGLLRIGRWRALLPGRPRNRVRADIGVELLWPLFVLIALPALFGFPWGELLRSTPDITLWLIVSLVLGLLTGLAKLYAARRTT